MRFSFHLFNERISHRAPPVCQIFNLQHLLDSNSLITHFHLLLNKSVMYYLRYNKINYTIDCRKILSTRYDLFVVLQKVMSFHTWENSWVMQSLLIHVFLNFHSNLSLFFCRLFHFNGGKLRMDERIDLSMSDPDLVPLIIQVFLFIYFFLCHFIE